MMPGTKIACVGCGSFIDPNLARPCNGDGAHPIRLNGTAVNPNLFQYGNFRLHSGARSRWKIECDALTRADWDTLAEMGARRVAPFDSVWSCGGAAERFAIALRQHLSSKGQGAPLVVDDVLTTGTTMEDMRRALTASGGAPKPIGLVVFARGKCPAWITPLFQYTGDD